MPYPQLDRRSLQFHPLSERKHRVRIETDHVRPEQKPKPVEAMAYTALRETAARIRKARQADRPVILAFGAHTIKNGLGPLLIRYLDEGWITHLATNGAGIIHDWEFAFAGASSEDVAANVAKGQFGMWEETGRFLNLALSIGAFDGLGYGESVGRMIEEEALTIPAPEELEAIISAGVHGDAGRIAAAADLLGCIRDHGLPSGAMKIPHPHKVHSIQAAAYRRQVPFTGHPMFGHDIIYTHPMNQGAAIGRTAERDFLTFADAVSRLDGGVYLSIGSAVMSPMIFEKSLSMGRNLALQSGLTIDRHFMLVVDLAKVEWDWIGQGEPPPDHPAYYLRYCKTFSRMGGTLRYLSMDNRDFLLTLFQELRSRKT